MAVSHIDWADFKGIRGFDIHVLRGGGSSARLDQQLFVWGTKVNANGTTTAIGGTADNLPAGLGVTNVEFVAQLNNPANLGVTVDSGTGAVTANVGAPAKLRNFLVAARVHHTTPGLPSPLETFIRIHVHGSVQKAWLTPSPLTVYKDSRDPAKAQFPRFTLLAQFDDETVGDISEAAGIGWSLGPGGGGKVELSPKGEIKVLSFPGEENVQATLPASWGGLQATAKVLVRGPWADLLGNNVSATLLSGPGFARLSETPNVLFIPEGFEDTPADRDAFDKLLHSLLNWLRTSTIAQPYNLFFNSQKTNFTDSINYWSVFLPSRERAASLLPEMIRLDQPNGEIIGEPLPQAIQPPAAGNWSIENLIFQAGLPVRADINATLAAKIQDWSDLFGVGKIPAGKVTPELFAEWINLSLRTLANERDTALGMASGERPRVMRRTVARLAVSHRFRTQREHLNQLLEKLTDGQEGHVIGATWTTGKDSDLVMALVAGAGSVGAAGAILTAGIGNGSRFMLKPVNTPQQGSRATDVKPYPLPSNLRLQTPTIGIIIHELSHAFGLGDEYGADGFTMPNSHRRLVAKYGNVQPVQELETTPAIGDLDGDKLRWRWPRIKHAGVLAAPPGLVSDGPPKEYVISLRPGHKHVFQQGEIVFLRQRPLLKEPSQQQPSQVNPAKVSGRLEVVSALQVGEQIVVKDLTGTLNPADFPATEPETAIVFALHAANPADNDAELVSKVVREYIKSSKRPLNRAGGAACVRDDQNTQAVINAPANLRFPAAGARRPPLSSLVGAFDGGATFYCGVFHPTGECMMRSLVESGQASVVKFCPVCQYLLVDRIDPSLHAFINNEYTKIYPTT